MKRGNSSDYKVSPMLESVVFILGETGITNGWINCIIKVWSIIRMIETHPNTNTHQYTHAGSWVG